MLVKEIIFKVCEYLENKEIVESLNSGEALVGEQSELVDTFIECLNLVRNEIATEMMPNAKVEKFNSFNGKINFSDFSSKVIEILSVKDALGNNVKYDVFDDHIEVNSSSVEVKYNAVPEKLDLQSEFISTIPERVYAYGILREFYYIQTLYEDASIWEARFKNSMQSLARKKSETVVRRRRWL